MEFLDEPIVEAEKRNSIVIIKPGNLDLEDSKLIEISNGNQNLNQDAKSEIGITEINGKLIQAYFNRHSCFKFSTRRCMTTGHYK